MHFSRLLTMAFAVTLVFLLFYCGGWVFCMRNVLKAMDRTQRIAFGSRSKFGDGYKLLPNNAKRA